MWFNKLSFFFAFAALVSINACCPPVSSKAEPTVLLRFVRTGNSLKMEVVNRTGVFARHRVSLPSNFDSLNESAAFGLKNRNYKAYAKPAWKLYQVLLRPVQAYIRNAKIIKIDVGNSGITVPLETLLTERPPGPKRFHWPDLPYAAWQHAYIQTNSLHVHIPNKLTKRLLFNANALLKAGIEPQKAIYLTKLNCLQANGDSIGTPWVWSVLDLDSKGKVQLEK